MSDPKSKPKRWSEFVGREKRSWVIPFLRFQWICKFISFWLSRWAFIEVLEYIGKLGLLGALIVWFYPGCHLRQQAADDACKSRHYAAWEMLNSAIGKAGNAGRTDALLDLNRDGVSIQDVDLSGGAVFDERLVITNAYFGCANLANARVHVSDLSGAIFHSATLANASFDRVQFPTAQFWTADFTNVWMYGCNLRSNFFDRVDFSDAVFKYCDFTESTFDDCKWTNAVFDGCNFANVSFENILATNSGGCRFVECNFYGMDGTATNFILQNVGSSKFVSLKITNRLDWLIFLKEHEELDAFTFSNLNQFQTGKKFKR